MKYLTIDGFNMLNLQLEKANKELNRIALEENIGNCLWRIQKRYIDGLEYLLDLEDNPQEILNKYEKE